MQRAQQSNTKEDKLEFIAKFRIAQKAHNAIVKECLGAQGFDRHLAALKVHAIQNEIQVEYT